MSGLQFDIRFSQIFCQRTPQLVSDPDSLYCQHMHQCGRICFRVLASQRLLHRPCGIASPVQCVPKIRQEAGIHIFGQKQLLKITEFDDGACYPVGSPFAISLPVIVNLDSRSRKIPLRTGPSFFRRRMIREFRCISCHVLVAAALPARGAIGKFARSAAKNAPERG